MIFAFHRLDELETSHSKALSAVQLQFGIVSRGVV